MSKIKSTLSKSLPAIIVSVITTTAIIYAWTDPTKALLDNNTSAPINVGTSTQFKERPLFKDSILNATSTFAFNVVDNNIGIGTTNPRAKLEINASEGVVGQIIRKTDYYDDYIQFIDPKGVKNLYVDYTGQFAFKVQDGPIYVGNFSNPSGSSAGFSVPYNVIIGVNATTRRVGMGGEGGLYYVYNSPSALLEVRGKANEVQLDVRGYSTQTEDIMTVRNSDDTILFNIQNSGNVGIGTPNPTQKLDVAGYVRGSKGLCIGDDCRTSWQAPIYITNFLNAPIEIYNMNPAIPTTTTIKGPLSEIPTTAKALIIEGECSMNEPDRGIVDAYVKIRKDSLSPYYVLIRGRASGKGDNIAWASQGVFPVVIDTDNNEFSFELSVEGAGFNQGCILRIIGYTN